jgi:hypothetical protein
MTGLNNNGQVVGYGLSGGLIQPFVTSVTSSASVPVPSPYESAYGYAINDSGQVAGIAYTGGSGQGFIGNTSGGSLIPVLPHSVAVVVYGLNNSGMVTGYSNINATTAFIANTSSVTAVPFPSGVVEISGTAINASGQITGWAAGTATVGPGNAQPYVGTTSGITLVPTLSNWTQAYGDSINSSGQIAGYAGLFGSANTQAFTGNTSGVTAIPFPSGYTTATVSQYQGSLNDSGLVVGQAGTSPHTVGWIWSASTGTVLLNTLLPPGTTVTNAIAINNNGLILAAGSGGYYILTPSGNPTVSLSANLAFGNQPVGTTSAPQTVTVTNTGSGSLVFGPASVTVAGAGYNVTADTCVSATLSQNQTCTVTLDFAPGVTGSFPATLNFADNAANTPQTVSLSGTGIPASVPALGPWALVVLAVLILLAGGLAMRRMSPPSPGS